MGRDRCGYVDNGHVHRSYNTARWDMAVAGEGMDGWLDGGMV